MNDSVCSRPLFAPKPGLQRARLSPLALLQCTGGRGRRLLALLLPFFCGLAWGQTHPQQASVANRTMTFHPQTLPGHPHRKPPQRLQPAQPVSETGREADRSSMAELAVVPSHPCHSAVAGRSVSSGCSGSAGTRRHRNDNEHLHAADSGSPAGGGRKGRSIGDEWLRVCHFREADSPADHADSVIWMVGAAGFEPTTSTV